MRATFWKAPVIAMFAAGLAVAACGDDDDSPSGDGGTGGKTSTGGAKATGGSTSTGGAKATGGTTGAGGGPATGGTTASGGAAATGGTKATGGTTTQTEAGVPDSGSTGGTAPTVDASPDAPAP
jgi:hypothetical protein